MGDATHKESVFEVKCLLSRLSKPTLARAKAAKILGRLGHHVCKELDDEPPRALGSDLQVEEDTRVVVRLVHRVRILLETEQLRRVLGRRVQRHAHRPFRSVTPSLLVTPCTR